MREQQPGFWSRLKQRRLLPVLAVLAATAFVLLLTLTPRDGSAALSPPRLTLIAGRRGGADVLANVALFLPFGLALAAARFRLWQTLAAGALLSLSVETAQYWIPGRASALGDVVMNTLGAMTGWLLFRFASVGWQRGRAPAMFAVLMSAIPPAIIAGSGWLLTPTVPEGEYRVRWAPPRRGLDTYGGAVSAVRIGDQALPQGTPAGVAALVRERLLEGEPLVIEGVAGPPAARPALILRIVVRQEDPPRAREVLAVTAYRDDLLLHLTRRAREYRLFEPPHRLPGAFTPIARGEPIDIEIRRENRHWCLRVRTISSCRVAFGIGDGWALLVTSLRMSGEARVAMGCIWVFLLTLPAGLVAPRKLRSVLLHAAGIAAAVALALVLPGTLVLRAWEAALLVAGYLSGLVVARRLRSSPQHGRDDSRIASRHARGEAHASLLPLRRSFTKE